MHRWRRLIFSSGCSTGDVHITARDALRARSSAKNSSGGVKNGFRCKEPTNNDHRMSSHNVDYRIASEFREVVDTYDRIVIALPNVIHARFKLDEIVDV